MSERSRGRSSRRHGSSGTSSENAFEGVRPAAQALRPAPRIAWSPSYWAVNVGGRQTAAGVFGILGDLILYESRGAQAGCGGHGSVGIGRSQREHRKISQLTVITTDKISFCRCSIWLMRSQWPTVCVAPGPVPVPCPRYLGLDESEHHPVRRSARMHRSPRSSAASQPQLASLPDLQPQPPPHQKDVMFHPRQGIGRTGLSSGCGISVQFCPFPSSTRANPHPVLPSSFISPIRISP